MNLFDSIGLKADPFSTSPNVDLFYPAVQHRQCLEGLELAIRMRRGLSVVRGGIGVGKTTISRKLIQNFKSESDDFDFYLILDPKFESEIILLKHIIELFGVNESANSVQECRNIIENYLLRVGVEQGKTLVLIVDEGQNLPGEMLDVFRTLLNFETDDFKLLQLIIFGQPEMGNMIHKYPNFEDRISFDFEIGPIALEDMKGMIDHRVQATGGTPGSWFTEKGILKIHKNTQGYPRKVTQLCHQLLMTMMSEEKDEINEEMVQRVIAGKINTGGLLQQKKKNYNEIAVNKLLDVLRKDTVDESTDDKAADVDEDLDDDWIGGEAPAETVAKPVEASKTPTKDVPIKDILKPTAPAKSVPVVPIKKAELDDAITDKIPVKKAPSKPVAPVEPVTPVPPVAAITEDDLDDVIMDSPPTPEKPVAREEPDTQEPIEEVELDDVIADSAPVKETSTSAVQDKIGPITEIMNDDLEDVLPRPGKTPPEVKTNPLSNNPLDTTALGISIDNGRIISVLLEEIKGTKTLLAHTIFSAKNRGLDSTKSSSDLLESCNQAMEQLNNNFADKSAIHKSAARVLKAKSSVFLTVNNEQMFLKVVDVPKENQKEKKQIIEWAVKKNLPFPEEDAIINYVPGYDDHFNVGVGDKESLALTGSLFQEMGWEVRQWHPIAQSIYNAFIWNYPEHRQKTTLVIHFGEQRSILLGCVRGKLKIVETLFFGVQGLTDALRDQGHSTDNWHDRSQFQVPETFIRAAGQTVDIGEYDDIFRPVFDSWRQEIDRTINGIRKDFPITDETEILLSGAAGEISYLDKFIQGSLGLNTQYLNPIRNIAFSPSEKERKNLISHPTQLTTAIGSALDLSKTVNVLPSTLKQNELFRWINRISLPAAALLMVFLFSKTGLTTINYNSLTSQIKPLEQETNDLAYVADEHSLIKNNRNNVKEQLGLLSYDTEYFKRVLAINRFLSFNTPQQIKLEKVNFQQGWEVKKYQKLGRDLVQIVEMEDEDKRTVRMAGGVKANPALKDRYFNNFVTSLEDSGLFQSVDVTLRNSRANLGSNKLQFEIKCII